MVEDGLVGVEAAAWLRAWAGMSMEAKDGLLDNSGEKPTDFNGYLPNVWTSYNMTSHSRHKQKAKKKKSLQVVM